MAITNAQQAKQLQQEGGPMRKIKGQDHMLAYITPGERDTLVDLGGQETMTPEGIPAYPEWDQGQGVTKEHFDAGTTPGGSTFETYRGGKNIGVDNKLKQKHGTPKQKKELLDYIKKTQLIIKRQMTNAVTQGIPE